MSVILAENSGTFKMTLPQFTDLLKLKNGTVEAKE